MRERGTVRQGHSIPGHATAVATTFRAPVVLAVAVLEIDREQDRGAIRHTGLVRERGRASAPGHVEPRHVGPAASGELVHASASHATVHVEDVRALDRAPDLERAGVPPLARGADPLGRRGIVRARETVVHEPVAVVVQGIADLDLARVTQRVRVVAVGLVRHEARGGRASDGGHGTVPVTVLVRICVPRGARGVLVHLAVAVVVDAVTRLRRVGVNRIVLVVAVHGGGHRFLRIHAVHVRRVDRGSGVLPVIVVVHVPPADLLAVAVLVDPVGRDLHRAGVNVFVDFGAVRCRSRGRGLELVETVHIGIAVVRIVRASDEPEAVLVDVEVADLFPITVLVLLVADHLRDVRVDGGVVVIAVRGRDPDSGLARIHAVEVVGVVELSRGVTELIAIVVEEADLEPAAVLVHAVAHHFRGAGVSRLVVVVAVGAVHHVPGRGHGDHHGLVAVGVPVLVRVVRAGRDRILRDGVAVVVDLVADDLDRARMDRVQVVATVVARRHVPGLRRSARSVELVAHAVVVEVPAELARVVRRTVVAVVVEAVALDFDLAGIAEHVRVVAVQTVRDVASYRDGVSRDGIAVAVLVRVREVERVTAQPLVRGAVAVVVEGVADFRPAGVRRRVSVVTVHAVLVVHVVRGLGARVHDVRGRTEAVRVLVRVEIGVPQGVVDDIIATIILTVARLRCERVDARLRVITVATLRGRRGFPRIQAVQILAVHDAERGGVVVAVQIRLTVHDGRNRAVVHQAVAVVVDLVRDLDGARKHGRVFIIAVAGGRAEVRNDCQRVQAPLDRPAHTVAVEVLSGQQPLLIRTRTHFGFVVDPGCPGREAVLRSTRREEHEAHRCEAHYRLENRTGIHYCLRGGESAGKLYRHCHHCTQVAPSNHPREGEDGPGILLKSLRFVKKRGDEDG